MGAEPHTLFIYGGSMLAQMQILQAIYDGPIDNRGFDYQPVILEKLPNLADGDARIEPVPVQEGDLVLNDAGEEVQLKPGVKVRSFGCNRPDCAIVWDGGPLEMAQLSATFTLLENVKWSDGEPLTAYDSVFSYEVAQQCQEAMDCVTSGGLVAPSSTKTVKRTAAYKALDERTVRWTGLPGFLDPNYRTNFFHPLHEHQIEDLTVEEMIDADRTRLLPMGWGAYIIEDYRFGEFFEMSKNPNYFRAGEGLPRFEKLIYKFVGTQSAEQNLSAVLSGECDVLELEASIPIESEAMATLLDLDASGQINAHITTGTVWEHVDFSLLHSDYDDGYQIGVDRPDFFGDVRTRQAIAHCMDRQRIVDSILFGQSPVLDSYVPLDHPLYNPDVAHYEFDPDAGAALLEEVGWMDPDHDPATPRVANGVPNVPDGTPLSFTYSTTTAILRQQVVPILADSLTECGIQINAEYIPAADLFAEAPDGPLFGRRFDMAEFAWLTSVDPPCDLFTSDSIPGDPEVLDATGVPYFPQGWMGNNNSGYSIPEYDQACWGAKETLPGQPGYVENHIKAQEIFARHLPLVPLFLRTKLAITRPDLCGLQIDPTQNSELWNLEAFARFTICPTD